MASNKNTPVKESLKRTYVENLGTKPPTNHEEISKDWMRSCGYKIDKNLDDIEDMWQPQFPSNDFHLHCATMRFMEHKLDNNPNPECSIKEKLVLVGFNKETASHIEKCCVKNKMYNWEPLLYWICAYFDVHLYAPISSQEEYHQEFSSGKWRKGKWYEKEMTAGLRKKHLNIQVIYASNVQEISDMMIEDVPNNLKLKNGNIWYHGTSAMNLPRIVKDGIKINCGNPKLDFSDSDGFYMSQDIEMAKDWAVGRDNKVQQSRKTTKSNNTPRSYDVVFVFHFDRSQYTVVDLTSDKQEWEATVNKYRNGIEIMDYEELYDRLEYCQYVYGAMSGSGSKEGRLQQKSEMQLCIRKDNMARNVTYDLKGIIYITPEEEQSNKRK